MTPDNGAYDYHGRAFKHRKQTPAERIEELEAQVERLRDVLRNIVSEPCEDDDWHALALRFQQSARDTMEHADSVTQAPNKA